MATHDPERLGVALAGGGMLLISLDSLGIRLTEASSWDVALWFGLFTFMAMVAMVWLHGGRSFIVVLREQRAPLFASGLLQFASGISFIFALGLTTVSNTVVIIAAAPFVAAIISHLTIGERTAPRVWLAMAMSMGGVVIVVSGSLGAGRLGGDLFAVAAIVAFGANLSVWRRYPELDRAVAIGLGGLLMAVVGVVPADPGAATLRTVVILAFLGGISGPAGRVAIAEATRYLPSAQVSLFAPVETIAATAWAWLFLAEAPPASTVVGGVIVIVAVLYGATFRPSTRV